MSLTWVQCEGEMGPVQVLIVMEGMVEGEAFVTCEAERVPSPGLKPFYIEQMHHSRPFRRNRDGKDTAPAVTALTGGLVFVFFQPRMAQGTAAVMQEETEHQVAGTEAEGVRARPRLD